MKKQLCFDLEERVSKDAKPQTKENKPKGKRGPLQFETPANATNCEQDLPEQDLWGDYDLAWWNASLKKDSPNMDEFFSAYSNEALEELGEDLLGELLDQQEQLLTLAIYLEKQNYGMPAFERFTPATWD